LKIDFFNASVCFLVLGLLKIDFLMKVLVFLVSGIVEDGAVPFLENVEKFYHMSLILYADKNNIECYQKYRRQKLPYQEHGRIRPFLGLEYIRVIHPQTPRRNAEKYVSDIECPVDRNSRKKKIRRVIGPHSPRGFAKIVTANQTFLAKNV